MAKLPTLEKIKQGIREQMQLENVVKQSNGNKQPLHNALAIVPESDLLNLLHWVHEVILPKVEKNRGADSEDFKNYTRLRDAVIWALYIGDCYERVLLKAGNDSFLIDAYKQKMLFYEGELLKYRTAEQLISDETLRDYRSTVVQRALRLLEPKNTDNV